MKVVYKIVNSAVVLALVPVLLFLPLFRFIMKIGMNTDNQLLSILGNIIDIPTVIKNLTGTDLNALPEYFTIKGAYEMLFAEGSTIAETGIDLSALPAEVIRYFTAAGILFAVALLFVLIVLILGLFVKKKLIPAVFAGCGAISLFAANKCFTHIAQQLVSGKISVVSLIENIEALSSYSTYFKYLSVDIRIFELSSAYTMMMMIFIALIVLNVIFHLVDTTSN